MGKPTSDQIKTAEVMKDAWNAEGSPFKGTEFDPSVLNLTNQLPEKMWKPGLLQRRAYVSDGTFYTQRNHQKFCPKCTKPNLLTLDRCSFCNTALHEEAAGARSSCSTTTIRPAQPCDLIEATLTDRYRGRPVLEKTWDMLTLECRFPAARAHLLIVPKTRLEDLLKCERRHLPLLRQLFEKGVQKLKEIYNVENKFVAGFSYPSEYQQLCLHVIAPPIRNFLLFRSSNWYFYRDAYEEIARLGRCARKPNAFGGLDVDPTIVRLDERVRAERAELLAKPKRDSREGETGEIGKIKEARGGARRGDNNATQGKVTRVRLPQENELANTCYFTYRMNFIICDQSLSQEEAAEAIKKGECHSDYKIMGADFQMSSDKYVLSDGVPPIEAAFWLIGMPENFQSRTMEECPAIMILSYVVIAEAALFLHGPKNDLSVGFVRDAAVISRTMKYQDTVMNSWAINPAFNAYQRMHSAVLDQVDSGSDLSVNVVVCRCGEESIELLGDRLKLIDRKATKLYVQELCLEETALTLADQARREDAEKAAEIPMTGYLDMALKMATEYYPQTFQNITLTTLASRSCTPILPDDLPLAEYTLFLGKPDLELGKNANSRYLDLVFRAMEINTFLVADFLHLGNFRTIADDLTPCQQGIAAQVAEMRGKKGKQPLLSTYRGELFVVKREPLKHVHDMRLGSELCAPEGLGPVWPLLFGKDFLLPVHEDDTSLPTFLRTLDENSTATLPKKISNYLTYVFE
eukprot:g14776.t1